MNIHTQKRMRNAVGDAPLVPLELLASYRQEFVSYFAASPTIPAREGTSGRQEAAESV